MFMKKVCACVKDCKIKIELVDGCVCVCVCVCVRVFVCERARERERDAHTHTNPKLFSRLVAHDCGKKFVEKDDQFCVGVMTKFKLNST